MATSQIKLNVREFMKSLTKQQKLIQHDLILGFTKNLDSIRKRAANEEIIKGKHRYVRAWGISRLYKLQPSHPTKLTSRTGLLKKVLLSKGTWSESLRMMRLSASKHLMFWVRPQKQGNRRWYIARASIIERGSKEIKFRVGHETHGARGTGTKRKFLEPAIRKEKVFFENSINKTIMKLRTA